MRETEKDERASRNTDQPSEERVGIAQADPWAHRTAMMKCRTCMWFLLKRPSDNTHGLGRCRRHAPTLGGWPAVFVDDWCGDHKIDETKL